MWRLRGEGCQWWEGVVNSVILIVSRCASSHIHQSKYLLVWIAPPTGVVRLTFSIAQLGYTSSRAVWPIPSSPPPAVLMYRSVPVFRFPHTVFHHNQYAHINFVEESHLREVQTLCLMYVQHLCQTRSFIFSLLHLTYLFLRKYCKIQHSHWLEAIMGARLVVQWAWLVVDIVYGAPA